MPIPELVSFEPAGTPAPQQRGRRGPRPDEIALMRSLAVPRTVTEGPIGRCVKRGWCRPVMHDVAEGSGRHVVVQFALTEAGRALLAMV